MNATRCIGLLKKEWILMSHWFYATVAGALKVALDASMLKTLLSNIDATLTSPGTISVIGSAATILLGQSVRQTDDIDVWADASQIRFDALQAASEAAGVTYDPTGEFPRAKRSARSGAGVC